MEKLPVIEKFGGLIKEELLSCLEDENLLPDACLLEAIAPFSGYYNDVPGVHRPLYLFLVLEGNYTADIITRATEKVRSRAGFSFDAAFGRVALFEHDCPVIRIRGLKNFDKIKALQMLYLAEGIEYRKKIRSFTNEKGMITLSKQFYFKDIGDGLLFDHEQAHHGYFHIPRFLDFETFRAVTKEAKYDTSILYFDAAYAWYFEGHGVKDMIRIYRENLTTEKLLAIKNRYLSIIK